jgi:hypothetical protein
MPYDALRYQTYRFIERIVLDGGGREGISKFVNDVFNIGTDRNDVHVERWRQMALEQWEPILKEVRLKHPIEINLAKIRADLLDWAQVALVNEMLKQMPELKRLIAEYEKSELAQKRARRAARREARKAKEEKESDQWWKNLETDMRGKDRRTVVEKLHALAVHPNTSPIEAEAARRKIVELEAKSAGL